MRDTHAMTQDRRSVPCRPCVRLLWRIGLPFRDPRDHPPQSVLDMAGIFATRRFLRDTVSYPSGTPDRSSAGLRYDRHTYATISNPASNTPIADEPNTTIAVR